MKTWWSSVILLLLILPLITPSQAAVERCHPHDKRALLRIKKESFNASIIFDSWDPTTDCCDSWLFILCDDSTNRVNSFNMLGADTESTPFPTALGDLPYLEQVIFHNKATGVIPASLSKLRRMVYLDLSFNTLTGPIPDFFKTFPNLTTLDLSSNALTGSIPPALGYAPSLTALYLNNNLLRGPIPDSLGSFINSQINLGLANNFLTGEIPRSLHKVRFFNIDVSGNRLHGDASFLFGADKTAWNIDLSRNGFEFDITHLGFPQILDTLDLSLNRIYGRLPAALATLPQLNGFNVSYNRLCGPIPTGGTLALFGTNTYDHNKCLCGTPLPPCH